MRFFIYTANLDPVENLNRSPYGNLPDLYDAETEAEKKAIVQALSAKDGSKIYYCNENKKAKYFHHKGKPITSLQSAQLLHKSLQKTKEIFEQRNPIVIEEFRDGNWRTRPGHSLGSYDPVGRDSWFQGALEDTKMASRKRTDRIFRVTDLKKKLMGYVYDGKLIHPNKAERIIGNLSVNASGIRAAMQQGYADGMRDFRSWAK